MFGIGIGELLIVGIIVTCPLVILFVVLYLARITGGSSSASAEETRLLRELAARMNDMDRRMSALETVLLERTPP
jgi:phage shock protein B